MAKRRGVSYQKRVQDINRIYDHYARSGLSNREIWRRYIYPRYGISERTLYSMFRASCEAGKAVPYDLQMYIQSPYTPEDHERR